MKVIKLLKKSYKKAIKGLKIKYQKNSMIYSTKNLEILFIVYI